MFSFLTVKVQRVVISIFTLIALIIGIKIYKYINVLKLQNIKYKRKIENYKTKYKNIQIQKTFLEANHKACSEQLQKIQQYQNRATTVVKRYQAKRREHVKKVKFDSVDDVINYAKRLQ